MSAAFLGEFATVLATLSHTRALGEASEDRRLQHFAASCIGWVHILRGKWEAGSEVCPGVVAHAPDPVAELSALQYLGIAYLEQGDPGQAVALLEQVVRRFHQVQVRPAEGRALGTLGEALLADTQIERAQYVARQGLEICQEISYPYGVGIALRALGRIAQVSGDYSGAAHYLADALQTFTSFQTRYEIARTHLLLAELAHAQNNQHVLTAHLSTAHRLFQELHVPHYVTRTEHLAVRLRGDKGHAGMVHPLPKQP